MNNSTNNSTFTNSDEENNSNYDNYYFILIICFSLMILTYISIYKIYCIHYDNTKRKNNKYDSYEYERLHNNYGTLEEF